MQLFLPHLSRGLLQYDSVFPHMQVTRGGPQMCHAWRGHDGINPPLDERASPWKATSSFSTPYLSSKQVSSVPVHTYVSMMFVLYRVRNISHFYTWCLDVFDASPWLDCVATVIQTDAIIDVPYRRNQWWHPGQNYRHGTWKYARWTWLTVVGKPATFPVHSHRWSIDDHETFHAHLLLQILHHRR